MIKLIKREEIPECIKVIRESFKTVADEFGITVENAPSFTAFSTSEKKLYEQFDNDKYYMCAFYCDNNIVGFYSILLTGNHECELKNLCVLPDYRHKKIGEMLIVDSFERARSLKCIIMNLGFVEENLQLREWYEKHGFKHIGKQKFDFFPFTCGYMQIDLQPDFSKSKKM